MQNRYFIIHKPYGMLSQFTPEHKKRALGELFDFPKHVYPVGRLDEDSEGLLLLTNDKRINKLLLDPKNGHERTYLVQLDGEITDQALDQLNNGVDISIDGVIYHTRKARAMRSAQPDWLEERTRKVKCHRPMSWITLSLVEGKFRQVRKMTAVVGFPTLRLVRLSIEDIHLYPLKPGEVKEISANAFFTKLKLPGDLKDQGNFLPGKS